MKHIKSLTWKKYEVGNEAYLNNGGESLCILPTTHCMSAILCDTL